MAFDQRRYNREYYRQNRERIKQRARQQYQETLATDGGREKLKLRRELRHFGVPLSMILRKNGGKCHFCGGQAELGHHLDRDGRGHEARGLQPGHDISRLVPVCRPCHMDLHRAELLAARRTRKNGYWSRDYDRCVECGRNDRKHSGHGRCVNCVGRERMRRKREDRV